MNQQRDQRLHEQRRERVGADQQPGELGAHAQLFEVGMELEKQRGDAGHQHEL